MWKCLDASGIASNRRKSHIRFICVFCASLWLKNSARKAVSALCLCLCLFVFRPLLAQSRSTLTGFVQDESGAAVAGAKVALLRQISNQTLETTSGEAGSFSFEDLLPGD